MPEQKDDAERARQAGGVLNNPIFQEGFDILKEGYVQALMACDVKDDKGRAAYALALRGLVTIRKHMEHVFQRGQIAQQRIQNIEEPGVFKRMARGFFSDGPDRGLDHLV